MPVGIGSVATYVLRKRKYKQALRQKDEAIAFFDRELAKPVLSEFSGMELVDATVALLDATVEWYMRNAKRAEALRSIRLYLNKLEEVYKMNKDNLDNTVATRKEMLALGLAVRHMAVALDQEFASLRALKAPVDQALHDVRAARVEQEKSLERFQAEVNQAFRDVRAASTEQGKSLMRFQAEVNQALSDVRAAGAEQVKSLERFQAEVNQEITRTRSDYAQRIESIKRIHDRTRLLAYIGIGIGLLVSLFILLQSFVLKQG